MKIDLKIITILGLIVVIALLIIFRKPSTQIDTSEKDRKIAELNRVVLDYSNIITKQAQKSKSDSLKSIKERSTHKNTVQGLEARISDLKKKPRVVYIREQEPATDSVITTQDSLIMIQAQRVATLEGLEFELRQDMSKVLIACEARFAAHIEKEKLKDEEIERLQKENRREKRRTKFAKILVPVAAGIGLFLGAQL